MLVTTDMFDRALDCLQSCGQFSLDTETTGLQPFKDSRIFSLICATEFDTFYFNFNWYAGISQNQLLLREHKEKIGELLSNPQLTVFMHNAKFDMHILAKEGIEVESKVHCTEAVARIIRNDIFPSYSLDALAKIYLSAEKDDGLKKYLDREGHYSYKEKGKQKVKDFHFWKAPLEIIVPYGEKDARLTYDLGKLQLKMLDELHEKYSTPTKSVHKVYRNEVALTKTLYHMEKGGIKIDKGYAEQAFQDEVQTYKEAALRFTELTGLPFTDSSKGLKPAFDKLQVTYGRTEKGNASFKEELISGDSELERLVRTYRKSYKRAHSYYKNFTSLADSRGYLHTNFRQGGTATGRISATEPALQTLPKARDAETAEIVGKIRRCFVPQSGDYCFFVPDFDQMEMSFFLDMAQEDKAIDKILGGLDVHQATADAVGITRDHAKTMNFMLLYGGGIKTLAARLGVNKEEARRIKEKYFADLPNVAKVFQGIMRAAEQRGYVMNWMGRISWFDDFFYKAPNYIVQGGTADIVKIALNRCHDLLKRTKSRLVLQVHDEIVFEIHKSELHLCQELQKIMETSYPHKRLPLTCGPEHSWKSLADKVKGFPSV